MSAAAVLYACVLFPRQPQVHSSCIDALELFEANMKECTYRDLWHMILVPGAVTHRMSVKSHLEQEREEETEEGRGMKVKLKVKEMESDSFACFASSPV